MKRHIPGLHSEPKTADDLLEGLFLVRIERANYRWHPQKPFFSIRFAILEPKEFGSHSIVGKLYCTPKALWRLDWFLRDFAYDADLLGRVAAFSISMGLLRRRSGRSRRAIAMRGLAGTRRRAPMTYSYTQISQYLRCPRSYRYRYLDGWREKDTRAAMAFGRCFEKALAAYFEEQDCTAALFKEWGAFRDAPIEYRKGESWDRLLHQGTHLLEKFVREERVVVPRPGENLQLKLTRTLGGGNEFVSYIDA